MKKDGFDTLIDHSPEKLQYVKQSLLKFANLNLGNDQLHVDVVIVGRHKTGRTTRGFWIPAFEG